MTDEDVCYLSAGQAIRLFRSRELSPVDLLKAIVRRNQSINIKLNCFSDQYIDEAVKSAKASESRWMRDEARPLEGLPVAVKDAQRIAGKRTTFGSPIYKDNIEVDSDPMIERLVEAGAIIHARTTTSELCISGICRSPMWGETLNPWNLAYGPGGSSGGSGAALAAGLTTLATGTDMGGSIRVPASACGVVGFKPPHGRNPDGTPWNLDLFNHCGPLTRTVSDIGLVQNVISGPHALDHDSLRQIVHLPPDPEDIRGFRVAYSMDLGYRQVDPDVKRSTLNALDIFRQLGCDVHEVKLGWTDEVDNAFGYWFNALHVGQGLVCHAADHPDLLSKDMLRVAAIIREGADSAGVISMFDVANRMYATFGPILEEHDIFICPTMTVPAVAADHQMFSDDFYINGKNVDPEFGYSMTHQFNILRNCPVLSVPSGFSSSGIPTGIQIVGRTFDDLSVYRAGVAFEKARGYWYGSEEFRPKLTRGGDPAF
ncbi:amidase [Aestuariivirga sp.]|uniref:amidase n=2 Tax=Aestuariivirga sp. TaxID=2650926 RepID=UPI00301A2F00